MTVQTVLEADLGLVIAPAGCGKTHLITETLSISQDKPYLVLTHTTAGVASLKQKLRRLSVPAKNYVVTTIDGWALRLANYFPTLCPIQSRPEQGKVYYPELRQKVVDLLRAGQISDIIRASYSRLLVDEYQDCDLLQHQLVQALSLTLPTVVFGDPMQCIFSFGGPMPDWTQDVEAYFPTIQELSTPWRWSNAGAPALGEWILHCRQLLQQGDKIDLQSCPAHVFYHQLTGNDRTDLQGQQSIHYAFLQDYPSESLLILGDSAKPKVRHEFAKLTANLDVVEPVEFRDIITSAAQIDNANGINLVQVVLNTAANMMTNVEVPLTLQRLTTIMEGRNRTPTTPVEHHLICLAQGSTRANILNALQQLEIKPGVRIYRKSALHALKEAISIAIQSPEQSLFDAASKVRERMRHAGDKRIPHRAIGSTLLLKGLECDRTIILDAGALNSKNLYVALSRGAKSITVFARNNLVGGW
ncbi:AAA family ATPase [Alishewanella sp. BS5-314]|uniref:UvrD-helicase domain-containing protein n=1 Tax=Alishewanella sp. BS5-314 TaxID=2755587 RepID=UPI0021BBAB8B|nr:UvrD-helicase domain-containing protein [Alishewanella sp. BS5-314]MCT8127536.1 AAA family ATPase [Alishewanella sp. BS5-314]